MTRKSELIALDESEMPGHERGANGFDTHHTQHTPVWLAYECEIQKLAKCATPTHTHTQHVLGRSHVEAAVTVARSAGISTSTRGAHAPIHLYTRPMALFQVVRKVCGACVR
jgi:hypothetical protein